MDPLLSLRPLSTDIKHTILQRSKIKNGFRNSCSPQSGAQDILICGNEFLIKEPVEIDKEAIEKPISNLIYAQTR
jgi:hypothetical protein